MSGGSWFDISFWKPKAGWQAQPNKKLSAAKTVLSEAVLSF